MIVTALLQAFLVVLHWILALLPTATLPDIAGVVASAADSRVWAWVAWANHYLPVDLAVSLLILRLGIFGAMYAFEAIQWALARIHVFGGD